MSPAKKTTTKSKDQNKTQPTKKSVEGFLNSIEDEKKRAEGFELLELFKAVTKMEPVMWGPSIIGFGTYHYKYESGREGDFLVTGFSPRKAKHSIYIMTGFKAHEELMETLGKYKTSVSCLYVNKLEDIDLKVLKKIIRESVARMKKNYKVQS